MMFDAGYEGSGCVSPEPDNDRPIRKQYTLKGVEAETVRLMRDAAGKEGMKIGSWVSLRMKEAAERALSNDTNREQQAQKRPAPDAPDQIVHQLCMVINAQREEAEVRFLKLERELHEITSVQRSILSKMISSMG